MPHEADVLTTMLEDHVEKAKLPLHIGALDFEEREARPGLVEAFDVDDHEDENITYCFVERVDASSGVEGRHGYIYIRVVLPDWNAGMRVAVAVFNAIVDWADEHGYWIEFPS